MTELITLSGRPASGTSTIAENVADELGYDHVSGGDIFRRKAREQGYTLEEYTEIADGDENIDRVIDERLAGTALLQTTGARTTTDTGLVLESRLAGWMAHGIADFSVWLDAPHETRVERVRTREDSESVSEMKRREESECQRFREYYGYDLSDLSIYDLVLDTGEQTPIETTATLVDEYTTAANSR